jgi:nucleotide-binding universal stress UspA family protein
MSDAVSMIPEKILVPVAFNAVSDAALEFAVTLAERFGSELRLLHIIHDFPGMSLAGGASEAAVIEQAKMRAAERFGVWQSTLDSRGVKAATRIVVGSDVATTILEAIGRERPDLLVFAAASQAFGLITEKLVRLAPCSVLLLRAPERGA